MCHTSSADVWWKLGCPSITVALLQAVPCPHPPHAALLLIRSPPLTQVLSYVPSGSALGCDLFGRFTPWYRICKGCCRPLLSGGKCHHCFGCLLLLQGGVGQIHNSLQVAIDQEGPRNHAPFLQPCQWCWCRFCLDRQAEFWTTDILWVSGWCEAKSRYRSVCDVGCTLTTDVPASNE